MLSTVRLASSAPKISNEQYCMDLVRKHDHDNFMCTLFLPSANRRAAFAIRALNVEAAMIRDSVRDVTMGQFRCQFWKDAISALKTESVPGLKENTYFAQAMANRVSDSQIFQNPVLSELKTAVAQHTLSLPLMKRLIESRRERLHEAPFQSFEELEQYADHTVSTVFYLLLGCMDESSISLDHIASHLGKGLGLITHIRAIPYLASKGKVLLPLDITAAHKVVHHDLLRGICSEELKNCVHQIASTAYVHLNTAQGMLVNAPAHAKPVFLPLIYGRSYLSALEKEAFDPFSKRVNRKDPFLPLHLWWTAKSGRY